MIRLVRTAIKAWIFYARVLMIYALLRVAAWLIPDDL